MSETPVYYESSMDTFPILGTPIETRLTDNYQAWPIVALAVITFAGALVGGLFTIWHIIKNIRYFFCQKTITPLKALTIGDDAEVAVGHYTYQEIADALPEDMRESFSEFQLKWIRDTLRWAEEDGSDVADVF